MAAHHHHHDHQFSIAISPLQSDLREHNLIIHLRLKSRTTILGGSLLSFIVPVHYGQSNINQSFSRWFHLRRRRREEGEKIRRHKSNHMSTIHRSSVNLCGDIIVLVDVNNNLKATRRQVIKIKKDALHSQMTPIHLIDRALLKKCIKYRSNRVHCGTSHYSHVLLEYLILEDFRSYRALRSVTPAGYTY